MKKKKSTYQAPILVPLGEMAKGSGVCAAGSSVIPAAVCAAGAADAADCTAGVNALNACSEGTAALAACTAGIAD